LSFEEAVESFRDPFLLTVQDRIENGEYRWQAFGFAHHTLIMVAYTVWEEDDDDAKETTEVIRPISARKATSRERRRHEQEHR